MPVLSDPKEEIFAQGLAQGISKTKSAAKAGFSEKRAASTGCNLSKKPKIIARVAELQARAEDQFVLLRIIDKNSVLQGITGIINMATAEKKYGDALKGYELLGKNLRLWDRAMETIGWNGDPSTLNEEQLEALGNYLERIAYNGDPARIEAARQRAQIEAGQIIEATAVVENKEPEPSEEW